MLSGLEIKKQIELGNIVISDFEEKRLNPNSYNIRLGKNLKVYKKAVTDPQQIEAEIAAPFQEEYMNLCMQFQDEESLTEEACIERDNKMQDIVNRMEEYRKEVTRNYALDPKQDNATIDIEIPEEGYILVPGVLYLGETEEYTETHGFIPGIDGRSTTGRLGIEIHRTAGFGEN